MSLAGLRKEYRNNASFRLILKEALDYRPEHQPFNPLSGEKTDAQIEQWKAKSAEQRGFDLCFKAITGINFGDLENE